MSAGDFRGIEEYLRLQKNSHSIYGFASFKSSIEEFEFFKNKVDCFSIDDKNAKKISRDEAINAFHCSFYIPSNLFKDDYIDILHSIAYTRFLNEKTCSFFFEDAEKIKLNKKYFYEILYEYSLAFKILKAESVVFFAKYNCFYFDKFVNKLYIEPQRLFADLAKKFNLKFEEDTSEFFSFKIDENEKKIAASVKNFSLRESFALNENEIVLSLVDLFEENFNRAIEYKITGRKKFFNVELDPSLDENQYKAASHLNGPIRVLAPAGAGKTKTLVNRILFLLKNGVAPNKILALAFNAKAAQEMRDRLSFLNVPNGKEINQNGVCVQTFHGFGYEIIRMFFGWKYDEKRSGDLITTLLLSSLKENFKELNYLENLPDVFSNVISKIKSDFLSLRESKVKHEKKEYNIEKVFWSLLKKQFQKRVIVYDDMIFLALYIFFSNRYALNFIRNKFEYILADEFQDLNNSQMIMLSCLSYPLCNVFCVGDDDQTIYCWRGANVDYILNFENYFPAAVTVILNKNYRSSKIVVIHSKRLIDCNDIRIYKNIVPRENAPDGSLEIFLDNSLIKQANYAVDWINKLISEGKYQYSDFAFLCRYNAYKEIIARQLEKKKIPHNYIDYEKIFNSRSAKIFSSLIKIVFDESSCKIEDYEEIFNLYLTEKISLSNFSTDLNLEILLLDFKSHPEIETLKNIIEKIIDARNYKKISFAKNSTLCMAIVEEFNLFDFIADKTNYSFDPDNDEWETLKVLTEISNFYPSIKEFSKSFSKSLIDKTKFDAAIFKDENRVKLTTIHSTKGNEYKNVVYFNLAKDRKNKTSKEILEERRVAYVAATRAIENLLITAPVKKKSNFLIEFVLNPEFSKLKLNELEFKAELIKFDIKNKKEAVNLCENQIQSIAKYLYLQQNRLVDAFRILGINFIGYLFNGKKFLNKYIDKLSVRKKELEEEINNKSFKLREIEEEIFYRKILKY